MRLQMMVIGLLGLGISTAPAWADAPSQTPTQPARPGTVNYIEGTASLDGQPLNGNQAGQATLEAGQELSTAQGKAEILLTPGVFLRLDSNSAVRMVSPDLTLTQVELEKGRAGIEVDEIHDQNNLQVIDAGVTTRLEKKGYYEFAASGTGEPTAMVFKGEAKAQVADGDWRKIKGGHELLLTGGAKGQSLAKEKPADFDTSAGDDLYQWSSLRSQYLAEANNQIAGEYGADGYAPGWYWNPYGWDYTFIGAGPFYSPFGWGFYPFGWGPWYGGGWYGGYWGGPYVGRGRYHRYGDYHAPRGGIAPRGGFAPHAGGFHGATGFHGGGMGGFHGGGFGGGGFHGGGGRR
jgi:hypothetical protein